MMAKKPDDRFQAAGEVAYQLKEWLAERGRSVGGGRIEIREHTHESGVGSGVFTRFALGIPAPSTGKEPSGSGRSIPASDRDTKRLDAKDTGTGAPEEEIGLAPIDDEDVLGVANRRPPAKKPPTPSDKQTASTSDLATTSDVSKKTAVPATGSGSSKTAGSGKAKSLLEEELADPEAEQIKKKMAQRAQFNPLQPPNYVPPSQGSNLGLWIAIGAAVVVVVGVLAVLIFLDTP
jgi:hypothetical protein